MYQRTYNILKHVAKAHDVTFIGFEKTDKDGGVNKDKLKEMCTEVHTFRLPDDWSKISFIMGLFRNLFNDLPYTCQKYLHPEAIRLIKDKLQNNEFDMFHVDITDLATYGDLTPGIPRVITHHNINSKLWESQASAEKNWFKKWFMGLQSKRFKNIEKKYAPLYDLNMMVSKLEQKAFEEVVDRSKLSLVPNGVNTDYFIPTDPQLEETNEVIYAGSPNYYPNAVAIQWWCEEVIPALADRGHKDVKLTILGSMKKAPQKIHQLLENSSKYNVHATGYVDDIRPYVARSAVYVVPLQSGGGTRLKVLDALAMGKAMVSTPVGCEGIQVTDGKEIMIAENAEKFADRLIELLNTPSQRLMLGSNGRRLVEEHYSWDRIGKSMLADLSKLAEKV